VHLYCLAVYQISGQSDNGFAFDENFCCLTKRRKTNQKYPEETQPIFEGSYLGNTWRNLVEIWNVRWWCWLEFPLQKSVGFIEVSHSYIYVKIALLFFLLITHGCGAPASWAIWHTTVCLDAHNYVNSTFCKRGSYSCSNCVHVFEYP